MNSLQQFHKYEIKGTTFTDFMKTASEVEFLISSGTLSKSCIVLYSITSKTTILRFKHVEIYHLVTNLS